ncbi:hypothetical protein EIP86_001319 [Pleurotus ostreatoroseus]|nr:hypothetical protein EIP86_001319 [Pleurotus ostreatoroseus]
MSVIDSKTHVVVVPLQEWGHTRPLTGLVSRIVQARPITVTFFVPKYFYERVSIELSRHLGDAPSVERNSIRLVALPCSEDNVIDMVAFYSAFAEAYTTLVKQEPVSCAHTGITMDRVSPPTVAIIDIFMLPAADAVRRNTHKIKIYCSAPASVVSTFRVLYKVLEPYEADALGSLRAVYERKAIESGKTLEDIVQEALVDLNGQLIKLPGLPPMYDYEHTPQVVSQIL